MAKIKAGIIGCGAIGRVIAGAVKKDLSGVVELVGVSDIDVKKAEGLLADTNIKASILGRGELIAKCDLLIEAASGEVSHEIADEALEAGKDIIVMSTGGLLGKPDLFKKAGLKGAKIYLPSGAVSGLDGVKSAMAAGVDSVTLTTRKPPKGLDGAPYIIEKKIDLGSLKGETVIFDGTAEEAVKGFPKNVNGSATLSLCGLGPARTRGGVITSPGF